MTKVGYLTKPKILGLFGFVLAGRSAMASWYAGDVKEPEPVWPWATISAGPGGVTLFGRGTATKTLYVAQNSKGTWYFTPIYTPQDGPMPVTASASYLPGQTSLFDIYYVAHIDSDMVNGVPASPRALSSMATNSSCNPSTSDGSKYVHLGGIGHSRIT